MPGPALPIYLALAAAAKAGGPTILRVAKDKVTGWVQAGAKVISKPSVTQKAASKLPSQVGKTVSKKPLRGVHDKGKPTPGSAEAQQGKYAKNVGSRAEEKTQELTGNLKFPKEDPLKGTWEGSGFGIREPAVTARKVTSVMSRGLRSEDYKLPAAQLMKKIDRVALARRGGRRSTDRGIK